MIKILPFKLSRQSWVKLAFAALVLFLVNVSLFHKFYFQGLLPFPGDLLTSFYFPWSGGGFEGFDQWTTRKDVTAMDVIRQMYPWKTFAFDQIKSGNFPLWNPHNFSGTPLFANLQSSLLFPSSLLFLFLPYLVAWIGQVIFLPFIFALFTYLFLRSLKLSWPAAVFGAVAISNLSYLTVWAEQLVVIQSALFLPLALLSINKLAESKSRRYDLLLIASLSFSVLGGHLQTAVYVYIFVFAYALLKRLKLTTLLLAFISSVVLVGIQLLPTFELYLNSARETIQSRDLFFSSTFPWENLVTILSPDFFGNPATKNFRGIDYGNFQGFFGIVAVVFAAGTVGLLRKNKLVRFLWAIGLLGLLFSLSPFAHVFYHLKIPVLSSGYPSRLIFLFQFSAALLAAIGFDWWRKAPKDFWQASRFAIIGLALLYAGLWLSLVLFPSAASGIIKSNLILPTGLAFGVIFIIFTSTVSSVKRFLPIFVALIFFLSVLDYSYFFNKYQPFAPAKFVFPSHRVFNFLKRDSNLSRFYGVDTAYVDNNFATHYRVFSAEGYDPLYIRRYGELLASSYDGKSLDRVMRSDALFTFEKTSYRDRLFDLLAVRFILDKNDSPTTNWEPNTSKFPEDKYPLLWQSFKWQAYERKTTLPRAFLAGQVYVEDNDQEIIKKIYNPSTDLRNVVILEETPALNISPGEGSINVLSYESNRVELFATSSSNQVLFLSDTLYPGWQVTVDNVPSKIYRANYAFRAVPITAGDHRVVFTYQPSSFKWGMLATLLGFLLVGFTYLFSKSNEVR